MCSRMGRTTTTSPCRSSEKPCGGGTFVTAPRRWAHGPASPALRGRPDSRRDFHVTEARGVPEGLYARTVSQARKAPLPSARQVMSLIAKRVQLSPVITLE